MGWFEELRDRVRETDGSFVLAPALPPGQGNALGETLAFAARMLDGLATIGSVERLELTDRESDGVAAVAGALADIRVALIAAREGSMTMMLRAEIERHRMRLEDSLAEFAALLRAGIPGSNRVVGSRGEAIADYLRQCGELLSARRLLREAAEARDEAVRARDETERARDETERVREDTQRAAGVTADARLSQEFDDYARRERAVANRLRLACAAVLVVIAAVAGWLVWRGAKDDLTAWEELAQLGVTIPLGALAAYLGREAAHHRHHARWAAQLVVQLRTFDAFCAPMEDTQSAELRLALGRRVFLSEVQFPGRSDNGSEPPVDVLAFAQQIIDLTKSAAPARA